DPERLPLDLPLSPDEGQLQAEQLVEHQAAACDHLVRHRRRRVDPGIRLLAGDQVVSVEDLRGDRVVDPAVAAATKDLCDPLAELPRAQAGPIRLGVDGDDATGARSWARTDDVEDRVGHLAL